MEEDKKILLSKKIHDKYIEYIVNIYHYIHCLFSSSKNTVPFTFRRTRDYIKPSFLTTTLTF